MKTFEVRKRLYARYDSIWKPIVNNYRIYYNYSLLFEVLLLVWHKSKFTNYYNGLLKTTDSLISIISGMNETEEYRLINILKEELSIFEEIKEGCVVILNDIAILASDTSRTKAYLQEIIRQDILPEL